MQNFDIPAGKLIAFTTGEYSDYGLYGHFLTLQPITNQIAIEAKEVAEKKKKIMILLWKTGVKMVVNTQDGNLITKRLLQSLSGKVS